MLVVDHVDGVLLCLWTAATKESAVHQPDDTWVWWAKVEWYWQGKPKYSKKNLSQWHFIHHKYHTDWLEREHGPQRRQGGMWHDKMHTWWWWSRWGEDVTEVRPLTSLLFTPRVFAYMSMENHGGMISTMESPWFALRSSLEILPAVI
jgi:hypothetical protein